MRNSAKEMLGKADRDILTAERCLKPDPEPILDSAAYHTQQATEKLIKTALIELGVRYLRGTQGHSISRIRDQLPDVDPLRIEILPLLETEAWATSFRYPMDDPMSAVAVPSLERVQKALTDVGRLRVEIVARFDPPSPTPDKP